MDAQNRLTTFLDQIKATGEQKGEMLHIKQSGETFPTMVSGSLLKGDSSKYAGFVCIVRDITEQKEAQKKLLEAKEIAEAATRAKNDFLANMSHEIRTPMNGVIGMTNLLLDTDLTPEQHDYARTINHSADALLSIINDILDFSKIESGKMELERLDFDLVMVIDEVGDLLALKAYEKNLEFACMVHPDAPSKLKGDPGRLRQILINLSANAIKFTQKGEVVIRVTLEEENEERALIKFSVSDTGIGIPKDRVDKLFLSFSQVDTSTTRKYGGTGLGLVISKQLIELMGGTIGFESKEAHGSTFWFTAPLEKQAKANVGSPRMPTNIQGKWVIVVDDNETNLEIIASYLKNWGGRFHTSTNAKDALTAMNIAAEAGGPFQLGIIDFMLPEINGLE